MYINDTHILIYLLFAVIGALLGQFIDYVNKTFLEEGKILSKESFVKYKLRFKPQNVLIIVNAVLYIALLYRFGLTVEFFRYAFLGSALISVFVIDYKIQIIPNRLNLTIFEVGLLVAVIFGISSLALSRDLLLGMLVGGGIFLTITLIGGLIAGKEAMGLGDVKLMGAIGLYFGVVNTIIISVLSFLIGAVISIIIVLLKKNRDDGYIPFGPFIVLATIITIFVPTNVLFTFLMKVFTLGLY